MNTNSFNIYQDFSFSNTETIQKNLELLLVALKWKVF